MTFSISVICPLGKRRQRWLRRTSVRQLAPRRKSWSRTRLDRRHRRHRRPQGRRSSATPTAAPRLRSSGSPPAAAISWPYRRRRPLASRQIASQTRLLAPTPRSEGPRLMQGLRLAGITPEIASRSKFHGLQPAGYWGASDTAERIQEQERRRRDAARICRRLFDRARGAASPSPSAAGRPAPAIHPGSLSHVGGEDAGYALMARPRDQRPIRHAG